MIWCGGVGWLARDGHKGFVSGGGGGKGECSVKGLFVVCSSTLPPLRALC